MKLSSTISPELASWAKRQPVFLTGSAPTHARHVNVSPKGLAASHLAFLGPKQVAYIDRSGSGCETIAHSYENGRLTLMFMSFGQSPRIVRLFCKSRIVESDDPSFQEWLARVAGKDRTPDDGLEGARAVIVCDIWEVQTSNGYGVPMVKKEAYEAGDVAAVDPVEGGAPNDELSVFEDRKALDEFWREKTVNGTVEEYQNLNNAMSLDGLPGLKRARRAVGQVLPLTDLGARMKRAVAEVDGIALGVMVSAVSFGVFRGVSALVKNGKLV